MECKYLEDVGVEWIVENSNLQETDICTVERLNLTGNIRQKITSFAPSSLVSFLSLSHLDLSRNNLSSLDGLQFCKSLESLNVYYNNISAVSELQRLSKNSLLREVDVRLNPVSVLSTEYRLLLVHALPLLSLLDNTPVTERDRRLAIQYHTTDQAAILATYRGEGIQASDLRYEEAPRSPSIASSSHPSSTPSVHRPPLAVLQPTQDAYDAFTTHGAFTPNPKRSTTPQERDRSSVMEENRLLREKYEDYREKYNQAVSDRIAKESYVRLQEDYYKSLKNGEELSERCEASTAQVLQLKDQIAGLTSEMTSLKQELLLREKTTESEKQLKVICRELQESIQSDRERHAGEMEIHIERSEAMAQKFSAAIQSIRQGHAEELERISKVHEAELRESNENFLKLQKLVDIASIVGQLS